MTRTLVLLALASASAFPVSAQRPADRRTAADPTAIVARAVAAMGGESVVRAVRAVALDSYGVQYAFGGEETPRSPARATAVAGRSVSDYAGGRRTTRMRDSKPRLSQGESARAGALVFTLWSKVLDNTSHDANIPAHEPTV